MSDYLCGQHFKKAPRQIRWTLSCFCSLHVFFISWRPQVRIREENTITILLRNIMHFVYIFDLSFKMIKNLSPNKTLLYVCVRVWLKIRLPETLIETKRMDDCFDHALVFVWDCHLPEPKLWSRNNTSLAITLPRWACKSFIYMFCLTNQHT